MSYIHIVKNRSGKSNWTNHQHGDLLRFGLAAGRLPPNATSPRVLSRMPLPRYFRAVGMSFLLYHS